MLVYFDFRDSTKRRTRKKRTRETRKKRTRRTRKKRTRGTRKKRTRRTKKKRTRRMCDGCDKIWITSTGCGRRSKWISQTRQPTGPTTPRDIKIYRASVGWLSKSVSHTTGESADVLQCWTWSANHRPSSACGFSTRFLQPVGSHRTLWQSRGDPAERKIWRHPQSTTGRHPSRLTECRCPHVGMRWHRSDPKVVKSAGKRFRRKSTGGILGWRRFSIFATCSDHSAILSPPRWWFG